MKCAPKIHKNFIFVRGLLSFSASKALLQQDINCQPADTSAALLGGSLDFQVGQSGTKTDGS